MKTITCSGHKIVWDNQSARAFKAQYECWEAVGKAAWDYRERLLMRMGPIELAQNSETDMMSPMKLLSTNPNN